MWITDFYTKSYLHEEEGRVDGVEVEGIQAAGGVVKWELQWGEEAAVEDHHVLE